MTIKIPKQEMLDILNDEEDSNGRIIEDRVSGKSRWSIEHDIIFDYEGKYYKAGYRIGATESQDEMPWDYEEFVEATEVHQVEKTIKVWEAL